MTDSFLEEPLVTAQVQALFDDELKDDGYIWNVCCLWLTSQTPCTHCSI